MGVISAEQVNWGHTHDVRLLGNHLKPATWSERGAFSWGL
jgi:hypothetical protein